jgi:hypothetical protein
MTRTSLIVLASAAALAGCDRGWHNADRPMRAVSELQCPDHEGSLTRVSVAADGLSCTYAGPRGSEAVLKLLRPGTANLATLNELDSQMNALMPEVQAKVSQAPAQASASDSESSSDSRDRAEINLPGFHLKAHGNHAEVRGPGFSIDADDDRRHGGSRGQTNAHVTVDGDLVDVRERNGAAIIKIRQRGPAVRAEYQLKDETPSASGWRFVGYDAHGPAGGALVVAVVKSRDDDDDDELFQDAERLVRLNTGS